MASGNSVATPITAKPMATPRRARACIISPRIRPAAAPSKAGAAKAVASVQSRSPSSSGFMKESLTSSRRQTIPENAPRFTLSPASRGVRFLPDMPDPSNTYALILAGGSGTRFWPLSRNAKPKQLLNLFGDVTLLEQTIARLEGLVPVENILILTNAQQEAGVREVASMLPPENIFAEPAKRDTAPAVALGIGLVAARNPDALMMVLPADQLINDTAAFHAVMRDALAIAEKSDGLVTIGIKPTWPCPSYGYIERGQRATIPGLQCNQAPAEVKRFR